MFYGGRLLSHLSANDPEVNDFISLRRLNRYIAIMIDSDKSKPRDLVNQTKRRIRDEFNQGPGFAWITKGREIENYVDPEIMQNAIKNIYPKADRLVSKDAYNHAWHFRQGRKTVDSADKIKIAREVAKTSANLDVLDLKKMMIKLVRFIHEANDLEES
jgi:hypothetical protein